MVAIGACRSISLIQDAGYPMAKNLRAKIAESDTMLIHDVNPAVTKKFAEEVGKVSIAENVREVAEKTVREMLIPRPNTLFNDESLVLSMI